MSSKGCKGRAAGTHRKRVGGVMELGLLLYCHEGGSNGFVVGDSKVQHEMGRNGAYDMAEPLHATNLQEAEGCKRVFFRDVFKITRVVEDRRSSTF